MKQTPKSHICNCCFSRTSNFYVNGNTNIRCKTCRDCAQEYTPKERNEKRRKFILNVLTEINNGELT